jgi:membrane protease YdiL (CAAX protease family)
MLQTLYINLSWQDNDKNTFLPIFLALLSFEIYWFTAKSKKVKAFFYKNNDFDQASVNHITSLRIFGFVSMGLATGILSLVFIPNYSLADYGLTYKPETALFSALWAIMLIVIIIPIAYINARKPRNLANYPEIRARIWTRKTALMNALGWAMYLFAYEFLFRGVLLIPLARHLGVWTAIAINIAMYSANHIAKGLDETLGAIMFGFVLCLLTLESGTIWIAYFVHIALAWTYSFTAPKYNPDMRYVKSGFLKIFSNG